jgi:hypothetical protein
MKAVSDIRRRLAQRADCAEWRELKRRAEHKFRHAQSVPKDAPASYTRYRATLWKTGPRISRAEYFLNFGFLGNSCVRDPRDACQPQLGWPVARRVRTRPSCRCRQSAGSRHWRDTIHRRTELGSKLTTVIGERCSMVTLAPRAYMFWAISCPLVPTPTTRTDLLFTSRLSVSSLE